MCPMGHGAPSPRSDAGMQSHHHHSISQLRLLHPALFSLHLSAVFGKSAPENRRDAKSRVVTRASANWIWMEPRHSLPSSRFFLFNHFSYHTQDNLLWDGILRLQRGRINFVLFPASANVILVPTSPGNLIDCVTSSVPHLLAAIRPFWVPPPNKKQKASKHSFICTGKCKRDIYI